MAFSGPAAQPFQMGTYVTHTPEDYHRYFHLRGVKAVVRLNNQVSHLFVSSRCSASLTQLDNMQQAACDNLYAASTLYLLPDASPHPSKLYLLRCQTYDGQRFVSGGFAMHELFFPDGSCPSDSILQRFLKIAESTNGKATVCNRLSHLFVT